MKKLFSLIIVSIVSSLIGFLASFLIFGNTNNKTLKTLPKPEITGGERGQLGIDKNINEQTIDNYLNRSDSVYRDMRMLIDPGNYSAIGGDSYLSGMIKGFEVVPYPLLTEVSNAEFTDSLYGAEVILPLNLASCLTQSGSIASISSDLVNNKQ